MFRINLILGIVCIVLGLIFFMISVPAAIILLLIGALNLYLGSRAKKAKTKKLEQMVEQPNNDPLEVLKYDIIDFPVAGYDYNQEAIGALLDYENENYMLTKSKFVEEVGERCYEYDVEYYPAQLVPEPENQYDPDAIAVYVEGSRVGYIARKDQPAVNSLQAERFEAEVYGGRFKDLGEDGELVTGSTPYKIMLHAYVLK